MKETPKWLANMAKQLGKSDAKTIGIKETTIGDLNKALEELKKDEPEKITIGIPSFIKGSQYSEGYANGYLKAVNDISKKIGIKFEKV